MSSKYTYGDIIKAIESFGIEATEPRINDVIKLHYKHPVLSLRMLIMRKTYFIEEKLASDNKNKGNSELHCTTNNFKERT